MSQTLASRRLLAHKKQFFTLSSELLPKIRALSATWTGSLLRQLGQLEPRAAAAWLSARDGGDGGGASQLEAAVLIAKVALTYFV